MAKRIFLTSFLSVFLLGIYAQSNRLVFSNVQFGNVTTGKKDSVEVIFSATSNVKYINIKDINLYGTSFTFKGDTSFQVNNVSPKSIWVYFSPRHNIKHTAHLVVVAEETLNGRINLIDYPITLTGTGVYADTYYSSTQNLSEEALKQALATRITQGYVTLGYNSARDKMFMEIDNWKVNGRGGSSNNTQCVYTGRMVSGYSSKSDAFSTYNLNTEHTWPQSKFNSDEPMKSDLHHLFITDEQANASRGSYPFGTASTPYQNENINSPSKLGSNNLYEPRNEQKGSTARAMLYFVVRHGNQGNFLTAQQENVLRQWALQYVPDSIDRKRNDDIFTYQKNRNPFVDHPEFLERITSLHTTSQAIPKRSLTISRSKFNLMKIDEMFAVDTIMLELSLLASGNTDITISNVKLRGNNMQVDTFPTTVSAGQTSLIRLKKIQPNFGILRDTLEFSTNDPLQPLVQIPIDLHYSTLSVKEQFSMPLHVYPNPTADLLNIELPAGNKISSVELTNTIGQQFTFVGNNEPMVVLSLPQMAVGCYFVRVATSNGGYFFSKIIIVQ
ncbi:MAG: endonuclease [Bacteroidia bacterium]|nr:endonuclease [Bacteroidia bacterium]MBP9179021.1 endonuclease [Bacteroidia bacterium]MBP9725258.1 endonuclease [Bacteroidia bacterium]